MGIVNPFYFETKICNGGSLQDNVSAIFRRAQSRKRHKAPLIPECLHQVDNLGEGMRDTTKQAERLLAIRLRICINNHLDAQGRTAPPDIARAVGLPQTEAVRLLTRRQWREGDVKACKRVATGSGARGPPRGPRPPRG